MNAGSVRANLNHGTVTFADLITTSPFANTLNSMELQGKYIREALEFSVSGDRPNLLQVSGVKVTFKLANPVNERVVDLKVLCRLCDVPQYVPIKDDEWYRVSMPSFLANGGDHYDMIADNKKNEKLVFLFIVSRALQKNIRSCNARYILNIYSILYHYSAESAIST